MSPWILLAFDVITACLAVGGITLIVRSLATRHLSFAARVAQGRVLGHDLTLEGEGGGGDERAFPALYGVDHGRQEVAQGLAGPGAGLDQEVPAVLDGGGHALDHSGLALAW